MSASELLAYLAGNTWAVFVAVLFFGASIFVHELGHFLAARRRGVKVARFSIGFGPKIVSWKGKDGVEYCLSWLPLGGYVALPQLADMRAIEGDSDEPAENLPPITYSTKLIVFAAGAVFNVIFAVLLASVLWFVGQPAIKEEQTTKVGFVRQTIETSQGHPAPGPAHTAGLRAGDTILKVDGKTVRTFEDIAQTVALGSGRQRETGRRKVTIAYEREGRSETVDVFPLLVGSEQFRDIGLEPAAKVMIAGVQPGTPAEEAGLKFRDTVVAIDGQPVGYVGFISDYLRGNGGKAVKLDLLRDGQPQALTVTPRLVVDPETKQEVHRLGVSLRGSFTMQTLRTPPWELIGQVTVRTWRTLVSLVSPASDIGLNNLSGPIGIANGVRTLARLDFRLVLWFVVLINVNLAIFNLLPIPVLDGGHMTFATIAKLRGKALPVNFIAATQSVFIILLFSMIIYVSFFDVRRIVRDVKADAQAREAVEQQKQKAAEQPPEPGKP